MIDLTTINPTLAMLRAHALNALTVNPASGEAKDKLFLLDVIMELVDEVNRLREREGVVS